MTVDDIESSSKDDAATIATAMTETVVVGCSECNEADHDKSALTTNKKEQRIKYTVWIATAAFLVAALLVALFIWRAGGFGSLSSPLHSVDSNNASSTTVVTDEETIVWTDFDDDKNHGTVTNISISLNWNDAPKERSEDEGTIKKYFVDTSCQHDDDCEKKNVGNCCGYYPMCVNQHFEPDPEKSCREGQASVCGWPVIDKCVCNTKTQLCEGVQLS